MEPAARERLLEAALIQLDEKGREAMSFAELAAAAGVDAAELTAAYPDLDACLAEAYERLTTRLDAAVRAGCAGGAADPAAADAAAWPARVGGGLEALLGELAARPALARALTRGYPALGGEQQRRYQRFVESFGPLLRGRGEGSGASGDDGAEARGDGSERGGAGDGGLPAGVEMLAVGAAEAIVVDEIAAGRTRSLAAMGPEILFSVLVPFLGPAAATVEMERARERHR